MILALTAFPIPNIDFVNLFRLSIGTEIIFISNTIFIRGYWSVQVAVNFQNLFLANIYCLSTAYRGL